MSSNICVKCASNFLMANQHIIEHSVPQNAGW